MPGLADKIHDGPVLCQLLEMVEIQIQPTRVAGARIQEPQVLRGLACP